MTKSPHEAQLEVSEHLKEFIMLVSDSNDETSAEDFAALVIMSLGLEVTGVGPDDEVTARIKLMNNTVLIQEMSEGDGDEPEADAQSQNNKGSE